MVIPGGRSSRPIGFSYFSFLKGEKMFEKVKDEAIRAVILAHVDRNKKTYIAIVLSFALGLIVGLSKNASTTVIVLK
jgi:hypothetical protein